jgi:hypothetical protein
MMHLPIPTWLVFLFVGIASFVPIANRWLPDSQGFHLTQ